MPDLIVNGSFESAAPPPTAYGNAQRRDDWGAQDGSWAGRLFVTSVFTPPPPILPPVYSFGAWAWTFAIVPGEAYQATVYLDGTLADAQDCFVSVDCGDGVLQPLLTTAPAGAQGWTAFSRSFTAVGTAGELRVQNVRNGTPQGMWLVDAVSIPIPEGVESVARHSLVAAYNGILARLKEVSGAPHWLDVQDRVFPVLVDPEEHPEIAKPFICFPLIAQFAFDDSEGRGHVQMKWTGQIHFFIEDTASDPLKSVASVETAKAVEDLVAVLKQDETLGGLVEDMKLTTGSSEAGVGIGMYGEFLIDVELTQELDGSLLGP
jgi:hypothetical protein